MGPLLLPYGDNLVISLSHGTDGSGQHSVYNISNQTGSVTTSVINVRTLADRHSKAMLWDCTKQRGANSLFNTRPIALIPLAESRVVVKALNLGTDALTPAELSQLPGPCPDVPGLEAEIRELMEGFTVKLPEPINRTVNVILPAENRRHPVDLKMKHTELGLDGCYCTFCSFSPRDCVNPVKIQQGFPINRSMEEIREIWEKYGDEDTEKVPQRNRKTGDYDKGERPRAGVSAKQVTDFDLIHDIAVMHIKVHTMEYLAELLYRIIAGVKLWINPMTSGGPRSYNSFPPVRPGKTNNEVLKETKTQVKEFIQEEMHITLFEGNKQSTGGMFKIFLRDKNREKLLNLIEDPEEREAYENIHIALCALTLVANSQRHEVDVDFYRMLCTNTYLEIVETFDWAQVPETMHGLLAHMPELIEHNKNIGLGGWSEEGCERMQASVKGLRKTSARTNDTYDNLKDVINHAMQQSSGLFHLIEKRRHRRQRAKRAIPTGQDGVQALVKLCFVDHEAHDLED